MATFLTEFPDYPAAEMPALPDGWTDTSWHEEACPSFTCGRYQMFIDYICPVSREVAICERFNLYLLDEDGCFADDEPIMWTNDPERAIAVMRAIAIPAPRCPRDVAAMFSAMAEAGILYHPEETAEASLASHNLPAQVLADLTAMVRSTFGIVSDPCEIAARVLKKTSDVT